ncbi:MAG TPA: MFS transporter, partial [Burkholderiaceae bacterium]
MNTPRTSGAAGARVDWLPLVTVALGFVMAMLDVTVVNVALGDVRADLSASLSTLVWVVDGYTLSFAALLLAGGALANRFGARAVYVVGLALFVVASILCGAAPGAAALVAARLLQGCAAALFIPSSLGLLTLAYPDHAVRARMLGLWAAVVSMSAASGPLVGGVVVTWLGWRAIFLLNVPIGLAGIWLARRHLVATTGRPQALNLAAH